MEEERRERQTEQPRNEENQEFNQNDDIAQEIQRLVEAMAHAARKVWSSEQRPQLEEDLRRGLGSLVGSVEEALERFNRSEQGQEFQEQASKVADRVRESALAAELKEGLASGLRTASEEVQKFADSFEEDEDQSRAPQDIPIRPEAGEDDKEES